MLALDDPDCTNEELLELLHIKEQQFLAWDKQRFRQATQPPIEDAAERSRIADATTTGEPQSQASAETEPRLLTDQELED